MGLSQIHYKKGFTDLPCMGLLLPKFALENFIARTHIHTHTPRSLVCFVSSFNHLVKAFFFQLSAKNITDSSQGADRLLTHRLCHKISMLLAGGHFGCGLTCREETGVVAMHEPKDR